MEKLQILPYYVLLKDHSTIEADTIDSFLETIFVRRIKRPNQDYKECTSLSLTPIEAL